MKKKTKIIIALLIVLILGFAGFRIVGNKKILQVNTAVVYEEEVQIAVTATGYVQPVDKVDVGTQVSGVIERIFVDYNSLVKKGQLLAELDKSTLRERLVQSQASLNSAQSTLLFAQQNYDRINELYQVKAATQASLEDATNQLTQAKTNVANAKANQKQAEVNLSYAEIYSPIDGIILKRAVDQGQTVAASFNTPTLFTIANNLKNMQVETNVDEADIGNVKEGQKVNFTVDSYPDDIFPGTVKQIRLQPTVTNNVVTYTVIIEAPNPEEKLFPGMTANVNIIVQSEQGTTIPSEALRFNPTADVMKEWKIPEEPSKPDMKAPDMKTKEQGRNGGIPGEKRQGKSIVWVQSQQGVHKQPVKTGTTDGIHTIITEGLNPGDTIILTAAMVKKEDKTNAPAANPLMPRRPGGGGGGRR